MLDSLTKKIIINQDEIDTGTRKVREPSAWQMSAQRKTTFLGIRQGKRRRNPANVLNSYKVIADQTTNAQSVWEKSLLEENEKQKLPIEYSTKPDTSLLTNQFGVANTSFNNFTKSKYKLDKLHVRGV